jgi:hypothetical protein
LQNARGKETSNCLSDSYESLACPGIIADDEAKDSDCQQRVNEPAKCRCYDIEQNADSRSQHLRPEDGWQ